MKQNYYLKGIGLMSDYGYPPTHIETPKVLVREEDQISDVVKHDIHTHQLFSHGNDQRWILFSC